jgi:hypothetical protein
MESVVAALKDTPIPTILVVVGQQFALRHQGPTNHIKGFQGRDSKAYRISAPEMRMTIPLQVQYENGPQRTVR